MFKHFCVINSMNKNASVKPNGSTGWDIEWCMTS